MFDTPASDLLDLAARHPDWHADAACKETPEVSFFPEQGEPAEPAKAVCGRCLVQAECLEWALGQGATLWGIWAGTTDRQRMRLRSELRRGASARHVGWRHGAERIPQGRTD